ncbi:MAG: hypothetical protein WA919_20565 [Coleofasciculaceae cyanobacterium]
MSSNLLTAGLINPRQLPLEIVKTQVAAFLKIPLKNIERLELWLNQIWIKFVEGRGKLISYRSLPIWAELGLKVIKNCTNSQSLQQLGEILSVERDWFNKSKNPELIETWQQTISNWRDAWGKKAAEIKAEEERSKPQRERQEKAENWLNGWQQVISFCQDCQSLNRLAGEMDIQSEEFNDLPLILSKMRQILQQKWQELMPENHRLG